MMMGQQRQGSIGHTLLVCIAMAMVMTIGCGSDDSDADTTGMDTNNGSDVPVADTPTVDTPSNDTPADPGADVPTGGDDPLGMVAAHNAVRRSASPTPDPALPDMVWDAGLAASAQAWADGCRFEHSGAGENLYASSGPSEATRVVESWASEVEDYNYADNSCSGVCGHYTQVVWRDSVRLGCGFTDCANLPELGGAARMWVCQYDPPGNFNGRKPY